MKERLNNALNSLDERLIQEAAEADRLESNVPKIMRSILIPTGAAAAAGLCVFALANQPDGGVSLNGLSTSSTNSTSSTDSTDPGVSLQNNASQSAELSAAASKPAESSDAVSFPESIPLNEPAAELAKDFGEKATLLYADDDTVIFTDFLEAVYYKDLNSGEITYSADVGSAIIDEIGHETLNTFPKIVFTAAETDAGEIRAALVFVTSDNEEITYTIDQTGNLLQRENGGFQKVDQEQAAVSGDIFGSLKMSSNVLKIGENKYIGIRAIPDPSGNADIREIVVFSFENDTASIIDHQPVFPDEYLDQNETTDSSQIDSQPDDQENSARSIIPDILKQYYEDKGITDFEYDEALLKNMSNPIDAADTEIVCYNGYDEWRAGNHDGIDITGENINGADISAPLDGTVITAYNDRGWHGGLGNYVIIDHGNGLATVYAHCSEVTVTENQQVSQGEVIARVGSTGFSTGAHLHFEIRKGCEVDDKAMALFTGKFMLDTISSGEEQ